MTTIYYPRECTELAIFKFCSEIEACSDLDELLIDFSPMRRIEPFTIIYVSKFIRNFKRANKEIIIKCRGHEQKEYAANMSFFQAFGLNYGRKPNFVEGNNKFVPINVLNVRLIKEEANEKWLTGQDIIEERSKHLAQILCQQEDTNLVNTLTFSIREIIRNVYEHSNSKNIQYCAQYWPTYNKVEISIADDGIGLKESLKANPFVEVKNDSDAIQQALMPAISSKNYKGARIDKSDPWHNSGFGLYMNSRICRLGGSFLVCSGSHSIKLFESNKEHVDLNHVCKGTVIKMVLDTSKLTELNSMLAIFKEEGYEIAKEIKGVGRYTASAASQMLSRDFRGFKIS
ncbi:hypothetical protein [uncultured Psychrobacter sp.]|uniref:hypothetical protein n=1 Tax=uncultured Psychrobacter sp. TaxID=259303 RepID=UPI003459A6D0